jgi:NADH-quinone oxidoreductase subunit G
VARITIDGRDYEVGAPRNVLEAILEVGIAISHFCYHPRLSVVGQCRQCIVEVERIPKVQAACTVPFQDGMAVKVMSEKAVAGRRATMEYFLVNHPLDCPICDQAGECKLQDYAVTAGTPYSRLSEPKRQFPGYERTMIGPHVITDMTRCIYCTRCIRFCEEIAGTGELSLLERAGGTIVWTHEGRDLDNDWSACVTDLCPVGALTTPEFRFHERVWYLEQTRSIFPGCEIGCKVSIEHGEEAVFRFLPRLNPAVNDYWMCDHGRFLAEGLNARNYFRPILREPAGDHRETGWKVAVDAVQASLDGAIAEGGLDSVLVLGSPFHSTEESWLLAELLKKYLKLVHVEIDVDIGRERRIKNPAGWVHGSEASPNSRGAEAAGLKRGQALARVLEGTWTPSLVYVADAHFTPRANNEAFAGALRRSPRLIVHARKENALSRGADIVLPVASLQQKEGSFVNVQGRVQRFDIAYVSPPIVRTDLEIFLHLGQRYGLFETRWTAQDVFERMKGSVPGYGGVTWEGIAGTESVQTPAEAYGTVLPKPAVSTETCKLARRVGPPGRLRNRRFGREGFSPNATDISPTHRD